MASSKRMPEVCYHHLKWMAWWRAAYARSGSKNKLCSQHCLLVLLASIHNLVFWVADDKIGSSFIELIRLNNFCLNISFSSFLEGCVTKILNEHMLPIHSRNLGRYWRQELVLARVGIGDHEIPDITKNSEVLDPEITKIFEYQNFSILLNPKNHEF